jgi:hypothetical protein
MAGVVDMKNVAGGTDNPLRRQIGYVFVRFDG